MNHQRQTPKRMTDLVPLPPIPFRSHRTLITLQIRTDRGLVKGPLVTSVRRDNVVIFITGTTGFPVTAAFPVSLEIQNSHTSGFTRTPDTVRWATTTAREAQAYLVSTYSFATVCPTADVVGGSSPRNISVRVVPQVRRLATMVLVGHS